MSRRHWSRFAVPGLVLYAAGVAMSLFSMVRRQAASAEGTPSWIHTDFFSSYYYPVIAFLSGENPHDRAHFMAHYPVNDPYGPFLPINFVVHLPFALLPPAIAGYAYFLGTLALTLLLAYLALRLGGLEVSRNRVLAIAGILLLTRPGHWTLLLGQASILLTVAIYAAVLYAGPAPATGGVALAVSVFKPTFGLPLGALLLAQKRVRAVAIGVLLSLAVNLPLFAVMAAREGGAGRFLQVMLTGLRESQEAVNANPATSAYRVDAPAFVSRVLGRPVSPAGQLAVIGGTLLVAMAALLRLSRVPGRSSDDLSIAIICLSVVLFASHLGYDLVVLAAPAAILVLRGLPAPGGPALRGAFLVLYAVMGLNWAASASIIAALQPSRAVWLVIASTSGFCALALFVGYLWLAFRLPEPLPGTRSAL